MSEKDSGRERKVGGVTEEETKQQEGGQVSRITKLMHIVSRCCITLEQKKNSIFRAAKARALFGN